MLICVRACEQYTAEEEQKRRELKGCVLEDFEMRVTLGATLYYSVPPLAAHTQHAKVKCPPSNRTSANHDPCACCPESRILLICPCLLLSSFPAEFLSNKSRSHYLHTYLQPDANTDACRHGLFWTRASSKAQQIGPHVRAQNVEQGSGTAHQTARPHLVRKARSRRAVISFYCQHVYIIPGRNLPVYGAGVLDWRRIFYALA